MTGIQQFIPFVNCTTLNIFLAYYKSFICATYCNLLSPIHSTIKNLNVFALKCRNIRENIFVLINKVCLLTSWTSNDELAKCAHGLFKVNVVNQEKLQNPFCINSIRLILRINDGEYHEN